MSLLGSPALAKTCGFTAFDSLLADVFIPHLGIIDDVISQQTYALPRTQVNNLNPLLP